MFFNWHGAGANTVQLTIPRDFADLLNKLIEGIEQQRQDLENLNNAIRNDDEQVVQEILSRMSLIQYANNHVIPTLVTMLTSKHGHSLPYHWVLNCEKTVNPYIIQSLLCSGYPVYILEHQLRNNVMGMNTLLKMLPGISLSTAENLEAHLTSEFVLKHGLQDAVSLDIATIPIIYQGLTYDFSSIVKTFTEQVRNKESLRLGHSRGQDFKLEGMYLDFKALEVLQQQAAKFNITAPTANIPQTAYEIWLQYQSNYWQEYAKMSAVQSWWDLRIKWLTKFVIFAIAFSSISHSKYILSPEFTLMGHNEFFLSYEYVLARKQIFSRVSMLNFARMLFNYYLFQPILAYADREFKVQNFELLCWAVFLSIYMFLLNRFDNAYTYVMSPRISFFGNYEKIKRDLTFDYAAAKEDIPNKLAKRFADEFAEHKPASLMFWQQVFTQRNISNDGQTSQATTTIAPSF